MNKNIFASLQDDKGNGACDAFPQPGYQIKGATVFDQRWADRVTEAGVQGCNWPRPEPRPASLDAKPKAAPVTKPAAMKPATFRERWLNIRKPSA